MTQDERLFRGRVGVLKTTKQIGNLSHASLKAVCTFQWINANRRAPDLKRAIPSKQWIHLRYGAVFEQRGATFRKMFERLGVRFTNELAVPCAPLEPTSFVKGKPKRQKWKEHKPDAVEHILPMIRPLMLEMRYDPNG